MYFRLYFRDSLPSDGTPERKAQIRQQFHHQLKALWAQRPLSDISKYLDPDYRPNDCYLGERRGKTTYLPIISEKICTVASLDILMLRPGEPGLLLQPTGDIDNRLKTLLDSLSVPNRGGPFLDPEGDLYCLLQDDKLITRLSVETDRLLDPDPAKKNEVVLIIKVQVLASAGLSSNIGIAV